MASATPRKGIQGMVEMGAPANPHSHFLITPKKRKLEKESSLEAHPHELQRGWGAQTSTNFFQILYMTTEIVLCNSLHFLL